MTPERCFATLISYPLVVMLVIDWALAWPRRATRDESIGSTHERHARMEVVGRRLILFRLIILFVVLWVADRDLLGELSRSVRIHIPSAVVTGLTIGLALLLASRFLSPINGYFNSGSIGLWMAIFVVGAVVEETWRAVCILDFQELGWSAPATAALTSFVFAIAHLAGRPSRILPGGFLFEAIVGLGLSVTYLRTGSLVAPVIASVLYFPVSFLLARRSFARFTETS
jgi:membrane protease YdiL (CAAX protease family)